MTVLSVLAFVPFVLMVPPAVAGVGMLVTPTFPADVVVGQTDLPASIQVVNGSTSPEARGSLTLDTVSLVPSCANTSFVGNGDCRGPSADPGAFGLSDSGFGEAGTACAGQAFSVKTTHAATGQVTFIPVAGPIVLGPPATPSSVCRVDFTIRVLRAPKKPAGISASNNAQTAQIAFATGTSTVDGITTAAVGSSLTAVAKGSLSLLTRATPVAIKLGSSFRDRATLTRAPGTAPPTGAMAFNVYGPDDPTCNAIPAFTSTAALKEAGTAAGSGYFTPARVGSYRVIATYKGDASFAPVAGRCDDAGESVVVGRASPKLATVPSPSVPARGRVSDRAILSGAASPTGTITFNLYGPGDRACRFALASTPAKVTGNGTYRSGDDVAATAGTYRWTARYSGDANNDPVASACGAEQVMVT